MVSGSSIKNKRFCFNFKILRILCRGFKGGRWWLLLQSPIGLDRNLNWGFVIWGIGRLRVVEFEFDLVMRNGMEVGRDRDRESGKSWRSWLIGDCYWKIGGRGSCLESGERRIGRWVWLEGIYWLSLMSWILLSGERRVSCPAYLWVKERAKILYCAHYCQMLSHTWVSRCRNAVSEWAER